jgi:hypothetical protein
MKASTLFTTIVSVADIATAVKFTIGPEGWAQSIGYNVTDLEAPKLEARQVGGKTVLKNRNPNVPNAKTVKVRYGPFTVGGGGK